MILVIIRGILPYDYSKRTKLITRAASLSAATCIRGRPRGPSASAPWPRPATWTAPVRSHPTTPGQKLNYYCMKKEFKYRFFLHFLFNISSPWVGYSAAQTQRSAPSTRSAEHKSRDQTGPAHTKHDLTWLHDDMMTRRTLHTPNMITWWHYTWWHDDMMTRRALHTAHTKHDNMITYWHDGPCILHTPSMMTRRALHTPNMMTWLHDYRMTRHQTGPAYCTHQTWWHDTWLHNDQTGPAHTKHDDMMTWWCRYWLIRRESIVCIDQSEESIYLDGGVEHGEPCAGTHGVDKVYVPTLNNEEINLLLTIVIITLTTLSMFCSISALCGLSSLRWRWKKQLFMSIFSRKKSFSNFQL